MLVVASARPSLSASALIPWIFLPARRSNFYWSLRFGVDPGISDRRTLQTQHDGIVADVSSLASPKRLNTPLDRLPMSQLGHQLPKGDVSLEPVQPPTTDTLRMGWHVRSVPQFQTHAPQ